MLQIVVSLFFEPITSESDTNGEPIFSRTGATKYTGPIAYTPLTTTYRASYYWGFNQSITYGSTTILSETAGIIDTNFILVFISTNAFRVFQSGATSDESTGLFRIDSTQYRTGLDVHFAQSIRDGQIWPRAGDSTGYIYLTVNDISTLGGEGLDFLSASTPCSIPPTLRPSYLLEAFLEIIVAGVVIGVVIEYSTAVPQKHLNFTGPK
ncbi:hypothetical protein P692DRAFT_20861605 [Suillus brevipes Sb2]|nr:hypothetical protein P692DRAFT_20861605 [Suillus brevipes Sb2]